MSADARHAATRIGPIIADTTATTLASIILLDREGRSTTGSYAALPEVAAALAGRPMTVLRRNGAYRATYRFEWLSRAAAIRVHHARPIIVGGRVVGVLLLSRSARSLFKGLYEDRGKIALGIVIIFALLVALSGLVSRGVTRPIEQLGRATRAVASGRGRVPPAPRTAAIEIQGLYADFTAMAAAIDRRSRYLRDFAHAVSHEFKTPLAGIRGAVELLQDHPDMAATDRQRFLANADADADRLALLVTRLLDLARADMNEPAGDVTLDPSAVIGRIAARSNEAGHAIALSLPLGLGPIAVPQTTIEAVLATLIDNSRQAGATTIRLDGATHRGHAASVAERRRPWDRARRSCTIVRTLLHDEARDGGDGPRPRDRAIADRGCGGIAGARGWRCDDLRHRIADRRTARDLIAGVPSGTPYEHADRASARE